MILVRRKVLEHSERESIAAVQRGAIAVSRAATLTQLASEVQREVTWVAGQFRERLTSQRPEVTKRDGVIVGKITAFEG